jgi:1,4-dihydroxy-2-naphthoate octaprenyltransferase
VPWCGFGVREALVWLLMLACSVLLQGAVNTYNDYHDYLSGLDTADTVVDVTDASIVYHKLRPRSALLVAVGCLAVAGALGLAVVMLSTPVLLLVGVLGAAAVVLYSGGPRPIASLPLGEVVSGLFMGALIPLATCLALVGQVSLWSVVACFVPFVAVALIMQTNNTCDIERDRMHGRRTLPMLMGRRASVRMMVLAEALVFVWMAGWSLAFWPWGAVVVAVAAVPGALAVRRMALGRYDRKGRSAQMRNAGRLAALAMAAWTLVLLLVGAIR